MNYIFDMDGTITKELEYLKKHAPKYLYKKFKIKVEIVNDEGGNLSDIYGLREVLKDRFSKEEEEKFIKKINQGFWNKFYVPYMLDELREGSKEFINTVKEQGNHVYFLTSRGVKTKEVEKPMDKFIRTGVVPFLSKFQLFINGIKYDDIKVVNGDDEKLEYISKIKPVAIFDDKLSLLERLPEGILPVCMTTSENVNKDLGNKIKRLDDFNVDNIRRVISPKLVFLKKDNDYAKIKKISEFMHEISRKKCTKWVLKRYNPVITGIENIPKDLRPIVIASTHRHNLDPLFPSIALKRPIHWTAELKMFIGKENLLFETTNPIICNLSSGIMKLYGAFPIARDKEIVNYGSACPTIKDAAKINLNTLNEAGKCLELGGVVGAYPEGTINKKPEEQNFTQLKSDRIFRLGKDHMAYILPVSTVWTKKDSGLPRVYLHIGEAIDTLDYSTKEISQKWKETINRDTDMLNEKVSISKTEKAKQLLLSRFNES